MKRIDKILIIALTLTSIAIIVLTFSKAETAKAGGLTTGQPAHLVAGSGSFQGPGLTSATTTRVYLKTTDTASSTISGYLENADAIDLDLRSIASSSASILMFTPYVSYNGLDYYPVDVATTTTNSRLLHNVGLAEHTWPLATSTGPICFTNEVCTHIQLTGFYGKYYQIRFGVKGANASVWGQAIPKTIIPN